MLRGFWCSELSGYEILKKIQARTWLGEQDPGQAAVMDGENALWDREQQGADCQSEVRQDNWVKQELHQRLWA